MIPLLADNSLPLLEALFSLHFKLRTYQNLEEIYNYNAPQEILLCRSNLRIDQDFLNKTHFRTIATATSGTDHIDIHYLQKKKIHLLDANGTNAASVADYVLATLAYLNLTSKSIGIIGMGKVGRAVKQRLQLLQQNVLSYDPWLPEHSKVCFNDILACDVITLHANLHDNKPFPSRHLFNAKNLRQLKPGTVLINTARGELLDTEALLKLKPDIIYCADVFPDEPNISADLIDYTTICTPHIAGHSIQAKHQSLIKISQKLHQYYEIPRPETKMQPHSSYLITPHEWQKTLLDHYNPWEETLFLKAAKNKKNAFLYLRKAHCNRHEVQWLF